MIMLNFDHEHVQLMTLLTILLISVTLINNLDRFRTRSQKQPDLQSSQSSQSTQSTQSTPPSTQSSPPSQSSQPTQPSQPSQPIKDDTQSYDTSNHGYGKQYRCSDLQKDWQLSHPFFLAIKSNSTLASFVTSLNIPLAFAQLMDFSLILPTPLHLLPRFPKLPQLIDYVQLPFKLWVPEWFFPDLVTHMPCPHNINGSPCHHVTKRHRWRSGGPRVVHGLHHSMYIHTWDYTCPVHRDFSGFNPLSIERLPSIVQDNFEYVLNGQDGVTLELHRLIEQARMSCTSFTSLRKRLIENKHNRMFQHIKSYHDHCLHFIRQSRARHTFMSSLNGCEVVDNIIFDILEPVIENKGGYFDNLPPVEATLSTLYVKWSDRQEHIHRLYASQFTGSEICVDSSGKAAKKLHLSDMSKLYSIMDVRTRIILHQQMLSSEAHAAVEPMYYQYVQRCGELNKPLPVRLVSDRGLTDVNLFHSFFPDAHINTDNYHFIQVFFSTLNMSSPSVNDAKKAFSCALYVPGVTQNGKQKNAHAEPALIIERVDALIANYSKGDCPAITDRTKAWWSDQLTAIKKHRMLSNPKNSTGLMLSISCSVLENFHRQINRLTRGLRFTEDTMRAFLSQLMFQWNMDRAREAGILHNWYSYDHSLLSICYESACELYGEVKANVLWHGGFRLVDVKAHVVYGIPRPPPISPVQSIIPTVVTQSNMFSNFFQSATDDTSLNDDVNVDETLVSSIFTSSNSSQCIDEQKIGNELESQQSDYQYVDMKSFPFSQHENFTLQNIVAKSPSTSKKGIIDWKKVARDWKSLWLTEKNAKAPNDKHVCPRLQSVLKQRYESIKTQKGDMSKSITTSKRWSTKDEEDFIKMLNENKGISYKKFNAKWINAGHTELPQFRFYNKRGSDKVKNKRKTETNIGDTEHPNKKSK